MMRFGEGVTVSTGPQHLVDMLAAIFVRRLKVYEPFPESINVGFLVLGLIL